MVIPLLANQDLTPMPVHRGIPCFSGTNSCSLLSHQHCHARSNYAQRCAILFVGACSNLFGKNLDTSLQESLRKDCDPQELP